MDYQYEVFISYSSNDREWAMRFNERIKDSSGKPNTFFDYESLRAGDDWEIKIQSAFENSKHMVVLWSPAAKDSDWVSKEMGTFNRFLLESTNTGRRLIFVNLQGMNVAYSRAHQINNPLLQKAYQDKSEAEKQVWNKLLNDVLLGLDPNTRELLIPLVILTLTAKQIDELTVEQKQQIESDYELAPSQLAAQYGATREDWKPVAGTDLIADLLEDMRCEIEQELTSPRLRVTWCKPDAKFWTDIECARQFVDNKFQRGDLSLLVIDPIALSYDRETLKRLNLFHRSFASSRTVIAVLPPFAVPGLVGLRKALLNSSVVSFNEYFRPHIPPDRRFLAQCAWNAVDTDDIRRHLLLAFGDHALKPDQAHRSPFVNMGAKP